MLENIDFGEGIIRKYIDLSFDENTKIADIIGDLKEDLIQIEYNNGYIIDVGWYPEFDLMGNFKIVIIKNYDWEKPLFYLKCKSLEELNSTLLQCVQMIMVMEDE